VKKITNIETGKSGERCAKNFLRRRKFSIIETNYRTPLGEIDIIARDGGYTVFIEVKSRVFRDGVSPLYNITKKKRDHIVKNACYYLKHNGLWETPSRIDVVSIIFTDQKDLMMIEHIKNAIEV